MKDCYSKEKLIKLTAFIAGLFIGGTMVVGFYTTNNLVISKDKKTWEALNMGVLESDIQIAIEKELPNIATDEIKKLSELCNDKSNKQLLWLRGVNCKKILISSHSNGPQ